MVLKNKKGIRRILSDKELLDAFGVDEATEIEPKNEDVVDSRQEKLSPENKKSESQQIPLDKNGFPVLDKVEDFSVLMTQKDEIIDRETLPVEDYKDDSSSEKELLKTRHGIQILEKDTDYTALFQAEKSQEALGELVAESLGNKSTSVLLKEKHDKVSPVEKLSEKERLKRFPLPQGQIDLHGYTAVKADLNVETYLRNAYRNGTYTVRVIVGRGLHSKDGPVLPDVVEKRVVRLKKEKIVFAYEWDKKKKSKSGAMTVFLNNYSSV